MLRKNEERRNGDNSEKMEIKESIKIVGLTKRFKELVAVNNLTMSVGEGELVSLLGVNGAGKTTTIRMLCCLCRPTEGDAILAGYSIREQADEVKKLIAVSPQESAIAMGLTVRENLELICGVHGLSRELTRERTAHLCHLLGLTEVENRKAGKLSGGYKRRLSIGMALVSEPKILFLDEPTLGLDVLARGELWEIIKELKGKTTIILTTHYMEEAESLSDRIAVMSKGALVTYGTPEQIKNEAGTDNFEQAFIRIVKGAT